jgi:hypothetical protein
VQPQRQQSECVGEQEGHGGRGQAVHHRTAQCPISEGIALEGLDVCQDYVSWLAACLPLDTAVTPVPTATPAR